MCRLVETLKINKGVIYNIDYHSERMNRSRRELFGDDELINILDFINIPKKLLKNLLKCRVIYKEKILDVQYLIYEKRVIRSLKAVYCDDLDYSYKYVDRFRLNELKNNNVTCDDILIIKYGRITDTSFTNIAFYDGKVWATPLYPLLKGTKRKELIDKNIIIETDIKINDLIKYKKARIFNSMIDFDECMDININNIIV